ncbi:MAG TPA: hypothetical protein VGP93_08660 [Polyangiaceae bacterium]|nr:hypothetical protein [Polyangiaceae bacterium]
MREIASARSERGEAKVGDFWVHRITGSFATQAMLLTERVVAKDEQDVAIEYTLEELQGTTKLLVWRDTRTDQVLSVSRLVDGKKQIASIADFDALIAKTTFVPDSNEGYVDRTLGTCLVGPNELDCETKSYRVRIGDREANLDVTHSDKIPGRDIGGEITTPEGEVIYRAELMETGHDASGDSSFAAR